VDCVAGNLHLSLCAVAKRPRHFIRPDGQQSPNAANLQIQDGLLLSEKVLFEVGKKLGKQSAHRLIYDCAMQAFEQQLSFQTVLLAHPALATSISAEELCSWLDPANYLGCAPQKVDEVIRLAEQSGHLSPPETHVL
jgi:adenylosuccinate lyase